MSGDATRTDARLAAERPSESPSGPGSGIAGDLAESVTVQADGGSRGNPGVAGSGAVVLSADGDLLAYRAERFPVATTNNVAEYRGLIIGLQAAAELDARRVLVEMDSKLVVQQMSGRWRVKDSALQALQAFGSKIAAQFDQVSYRWIPRDLNAAADWLANRAMDRLPAEPPPMVKHGPVTVRQGTPTLTKPDSYVTWAAGNRLSEVQRVERTASLAAYGLGGDSSQVAEALIAAHAAELAEIWDNLPGAQFLRNAIRRHPLAWNAGATRTDRHDGDDAQWGS